MKWKVVITQNIKYREEIVAYFHCADIAANFIAYLAGYLENVSFELIPIEEDKKDGENQ